MAFPAPNACWEGQNGARQAFNALDLNGDGFAAHGELLNALSQLPKPMAGAAAADLFHGADVNQDSVVEFPEFKKVFEEVHHVAPKGQTENVRVQVKQPKTSQQNPRVPQVLQELGLSEPPLSMSRRLSHPSGQMPEVRPWDGLSASRDCLQSPGFESGQWPRAFLF